MACIYVYKSVSTPYGYRYGESLNRSALRTMEEAEHIASTTEVGPDEYIYAQDLWGGYILHTDTYMWNGESFRLESSYSNWTGD